MDYRDQLMSQSVGYANSQLYNKTNDLGFGKTMAFNRDLLAYCDKKITRSEKAMRSVAYDSERFVQHYFKLTKSLMRGIDSLVEDYK